MPCPRIDFHPQCVSVRLNGVAPAGASRRRRPVIGVTDKDEGVGLKRGCGWVASGIIRHCRGERRLARLADDASQHCFEHRPPAMREADHADPHSTDLKRGTEVGGAIEGIARLRLGWHQATAIADLSEAPRPETVDQKRREPPPRETARPLSIMQTDAVAAMQDDNSTRRRGARRQVKLGRRVTERRPNFRGIKTCALTGPAVQLRKVKRSRTPLVVNFELWNVSSC